MQIKRTKLLMQSLEVSKSCDNPIVEDTCKEIESAFAKAAALLETRRDILQRKKNITDKMEVSLNIKENNRPILVRYLLKVFIVYVRKTCSI